MPKVLWLNPMSIIPGGGASVQAQQSSGGGMVQYPQLTATNYTSWLIRVQAMMEDQGVWEAIVPAGGHEQSKLIQKLLEKQQNNLIVKVTR
jgi:hypothetical protein